LSSELFLSLPLMTQRAAPGPGIRSRLDRLPICVNCSAIAVRSKERVNGTLMTLMTLISADKTLKDQRQSAPSVSSAFYEPVH
jgi:hypothetical protein